jgi:peroxiredoxin
MKGNRFMRIGIMVGVVLCVTLAGLFVPAGAGDQKKCELMQRSGEAEVGKDAPWFAGWTLGNSVLNSKILFKDARTQRVAYVYFATYCVACRYGLEQLKLHKARLDAAGVTVVLVDYMEDAADVKPYLDKMGLAGFIVALDKFGQNGRKFGIEKKTKNDVSVALPRTFVVGRDGKLAKIIGAEGEDYVEQLLN